MRDLYTSDYEGHKNRNPQRTAETCEWVFNHAKYINWESQHTSSLLWVSADPGCGKFVLASFLIDRFKSSRFQNTLPSTICFFFFKDDNDEQNNAISAISSILHQLLAATSKFIKHAHEQYIIKGERLFRELRSLWNILLSAATDETSKQVICIIDGLDECQNTSRSEFLQLLSEFCTKSIRQSQARTQLKILLLSRPYIFIEDALHHPLTIRMKMEDESDLTVADIELMIKHRISIFGNKRNVSKNGQKQLIDRLISSAGQTFLWVSLVLADLESSLRTSEATLEKLLDQISANLYALYETILGKSQNPKNARKILYVIFGAARPLSLEEMNVAFVIKPEDRHYERLNLESAIETIIRKLCGFFVKVIDSKIYLVHQTAREFLIDINNSRTEDLDMWQNSLNPLEADNVLAQICVSYLMLKDFEERPLITNDDLDDKEMIRRYLEKHDFLNYAATHWVFHFRKTQSRATNLTIESVLSLLITQSERFQTWFIIFRISEEAFRTRYSNAKDATSLNVASYLGCESIVKLLLEKGADINARSNRGFYHQTSMMLAIEEGHDTVTRLLLDKGANFELRSPRTGTALNLAAQMGSEPMVKLLLKKGANPNRKVWSDQMPLHGAAKGGHMSVVKLLLEKGADVNALGIDGNAALHSATRKGHESMVELLLENGAFADIKDYKGNTALHIPFEKSYGPATKKKHELVVKVLMENGANPQVQNKVGDTALHLAVKNSAELIAKLLVERRAGNDIQDRLGNTALHLAVDSQSESMVKLLLENQASIDVQNASGRTALHLAVLLWTVFEDLARLLIENHASVDVQDIDGRTALHLAVVDRSDLKVKLLLENHASVDVQDNIGRTALHLAVVNGSDLIVKLLLEHHTSVDVQDNGGNTALHDGVEEGEAFIVDLLLQNGARHDISNKAGFTTLDLANRKSRSSIATLFRRYGAR